MSLVLLDSTPLGLLVHRRVDLRATAEDWLSQLAASHTPVLPEISWFELRRELLRLDVAESVDRLDHLRAQMVYARVTTRTLKGASELWAEARRTGRPTAAERSLDIDVILAATSLEMGSASGTEVIVATANVRHLLQFVDARQWDSIQP